MPGAAAPPEPDWYADPGGSHEYRFWDGSRWTDGVADSGRVTEAPLPDPSQAGQPLLPARAGWLALLGIVAGLVLSVVGAVLGYLIAPHVLAVRLAIAQLGLWAGLLGACRLASRRYGTGRFRHDLAIRFKRRDVWRGLGWAFVARIGVLVVAVILTAIDRRLVGSNLVVPRDSERAALVTLALIAAVGAPLIEETFFRGLLLRSLQTRWGPRVAVPGQALVFGLCHASPALGLANVSVILSTAVAGGVLGALAVHYRRLGPGIWTHAWFNLAAVAILLAAA